jgi:hypothetical protein
MVDGARIASTDDVAWDRKAQLEVTSRVTVDLDRVRHECGLDRSALVRLVATWQCAATSSRSVGAQLVVDRSATYPLTFGVDPRDVAGDVVLTRLVLFEASSGSVDPLSAGRRGAVLWRESPRASTTIATYGGTQLATEALDFGGLDDTDSAAAWRLDTDLSDLHDTPMRALRLVVNSSHPTIERLLAGVDDDETRSAQSVLRWDVARQLVEAALDHGVFVEGFGGFPDDSAGGVLETLFESCFPETTPRELQRMRVDAPAQFEALLQARLQLLRPT